VNLGLKLVETPEIEASEGDEIELTPGGVVNKTTGKTFATNPLPKSRQAIIDAGGLIAYTRKRVVDRSQAK
jgi:3-isopropylmalate/(R)-2-methylmalate dehydratase small subunit